MDSFQVIDLVVMLEKEFDIDVDDAIIENFENRDAIIRLVKRLVEK